MTRILKVFSTIAMQSALEVLVPQFEAQGGLHLDIAWNTAPVLVKRLQAGETADLLILNRAGIDTMTREGRPVFEGSTRTSQIKRPLEELAGFLFLELEFPRGTFLMTGTGIVPPHDFSMSRGDTVRISIGQLTLENQVASARAARA